MTVKLEWGFKSRLVMQAAVEEKVALAEMRSALDEARDYERRRLERRMGLTASALATYPVVSLALGEGFAWFWGLPSAAFLLAFLSIGMAPMVVLLVVAHRWNTTWSPRPGTKEFGRAALWALVVMLVVALNMLAVSSASTLTADGFRGGPHAFLESGAQMGSLGALAVGLYRLARDRLMGGFGAVNVALGLVVPYLGFFIAARPAASTINQLEVVASAAQLAALVLMAVVRFARAGGRWRK